MITGIRTHKRYVRYTDGIHKWYRAVLDCDPLRHELRVSRRKFTRAAVAENYGIRVSMRLERLRKKMKEDGDGSKDVSA